MRQLCFVGTAFLILCLSACSSKDDKKDGKDGKDPKKEPTNAEKIIGTWEVVKGEMPSGSTIEFTKDGNMIVTIIDKGKSMTVPAGTYKVEGETIKASHKVGDKEETETLKIKTLTDTKLITEDEKSKIDEFKKK